VAEELGGDVHRESGGDRFGGEDTPEVVRREPQRTSVRTSQAGEGDGSVQEDLDAVGGEDLLPEAPWPLEQEREERAVQPLGLVVAGHQRQLLGVAADAGDDGLSTSASSGLTTRSRSRSVFDGVTCSRGMTSPVVGTV